MTFQYLGKDFLVVWDQWRFQVLIMVFFAWKGRRGFLLSGFRIENIIIKFSREFSKEVNF